MLGTIVPVPTGLRATDVERAVELLDERGWCQGTLVDSDGRMCALGAVGLAQKERGHPRSIGDTLYLGYLVDMTNGVASYNDAPGRTKEEVQDLLMAVAKKLRELGR